MLKVNIHNYKTSKNINIKIVQLTDIHYSNKFDIEDKIINILKEKKPNYIVLTGDIIDNTNYLDNEDNKEKIKKFIERMSEVSEVLLIFGSHDLEITYCKEYNYLERKKIWFNMFKNAKNIHILDNICYEDNNINFIGITLPGEYYHEFPYESEEVLNNLLKSVNYKISNKKYNVMLIHSPRRIINKINSPLIKGIDLILCGHMHDGVVPKILKKLPTSIGFISPQKRLFPKYARGLSKIKIDNHETKLFVSGGVTKVSPALSSFFQKIKCLYDNEIEIINISGFKHE